MEYDLNQLSDSARLQRLLNTLLVARFGENARLTPLRGPDGGSDGETAPDNPHMEFQSSPPAQPTANPLFAPPSPGRYLFQAKFHSTTDHRLSELRTVVIRDFNRELTTNVLNRDDRQDVNYFFLVTNVPSSRDAISAVDKIRQEFQSAHPRLHSDIWWGEQLKAFLDWSPELWPAFPEIFPGNTPPILAQIMNSEEGLPRSFRLAINQQFRRDLTVKFRQIELDHNIFDLFVDLDVSIPPPIDDRPFVRRFSPNLDSRLGARRGVYDPFFSSLTALDMIVNDEVGIPRILLEGGPGQGKSTVTQIAAQLYRARLLERSEGIARNPSWQQVSKPRIPFRIELRALSEWMVEPDNVSLEQYIAWTISRDSGGSACSVDDVHALVSRSAVILILDGLDEIGNDFLRDRTVDEIMETIARFEDALHADLRVVLTTRPPALAGRRDKLDGFVRTILAPLDTRLVDDYLSRWLLAQVDDTENQERIENIFNTRRSEPHVEALARNPMQLSVLLQFIMLRDNAFPDRRADLYREYFQIVIDRDVEKSPELRNNRELIEDLHSFLGFYFHGATELNQARRTITRRDIVRLSAARFIHEGEPDESAERFFSLGEERFGLVVALSGEGENTNYGFEVQPIQEYFAASYISNHLAAAEAHGIFQLLVRRDYWREVALFLAGLRRPNEKADLVVRAKASDREPLPPWTQNGRSLILQLIREGVLNQPRHVLYEAMDFISDLLDLSRLVLHRDHQSLVDTLCHIGRLYPSPRLTDRIQILLDQSSTCADDHATAVVHRLALAILPVEQYKSHIQHYHSTMKTSIALVRLSLPYSIVHDLATLTSHSDYWKGVPLSVWAERFWDSALHHRFVIDATYPHGLHTQLVVQFAVDYSFRRLRETSVIDLQGDQPMAIWKLQRNLDVMRMYAHFEGRTVSGRRSRSPNTDTHIAAHLPVKSVSYLGLSEDLTSCISDLLNASDHVVASLARDDASGLDSSIERYATIIKQHMCDPGLSGWVACRCATEFLHTLMQFDTRRRIPTDFIDSLRAFYPLDRMPSQNRHFLFSRSWVTIPFAIRMRHEEEPIPIDQIIASHLSRKNGNTDLTTCPWIGDIPLPAAIVRPLVEACRSDLTTLLRFLGQRKIVGISSGRRLMIQDTRRILTICRSTDDIAVLQGASVVLLVASFDRIAKPSLLAKILAAAPAAQLVARVFSRGAYPGGDDSEARKKRQMFLSAVAQEILADPRRYPFRVVSKAVGYVAEADVSKSAPLFEVRPDIAPVRL